MCRHSASRRRWPSWARSSTTDRPLCALRPPGLSGKSPAHMASAPRCSIPSRSLPPSGGGNWVHRIPQALAALGVGLYILIECPRAANIQLQFPPGNVVTLRTAKLQRRDRCRLTVPHTTLWHGHRRPHHPFSDNDDTWPAPEQECLTQCADKHLHSCRREQGPTDHPGWRDTLVNLFHTTGKRDPRLRLMHPTRTKQDAHSGLRVTPDGQHIHVGGHRRQDSLSPPTQGAVYHPPAALIYILRDLLADGEHQAPNADVAWHEPLPPRPHAPAPVWLMTTDDQWARAAEEAQLWAAWVIVQVEAGQPRPPGQPRGITLLVATAVPHDTHMAVHVRRTSLMTQGTWSGTNAEARHGSGST